MQNNGEGWLSAKDYASVHAAVGAGPSLNDCISGWVDLVAAVEDGYEDNFYEFTNALAVRGRLDDLLRSVTEPVRISLTSRLAPLDARFIQATEPSELVLGADWWCRQPKVLVGELREDLVREG